MQILHLSFLPVISQLVSQLSFGLKIAIWGVGILCFDSVVYELWQLYGSVCKSLIGGEQKQRPTLNFSFGNRETEERGVGGLCGAAVAGPCYKPPIFCPL